MYVKMLFISFVVTSSLVGPRSVHAAVSRERIEADAQRRMGAALDLTINRSVQPLAARSEAHRRMGTSIHRFAAVLDGTADREFDQDVADWIEASLVMAARSEGAALWSVQSTSAVDESVKDIARRFKGLSNAQCRRLMVDRDQFLADAAAFRRSLLQYVVTKMGASGTIRLKLGGGMGLWKNALLEARGEGNKLFIDPTKLEGQSRVILDCTDSTLDSRILVLALVREMFDAASVGDRQDRRALYNIISPVFDPEHLEIMRHPASSEQLRPGLEPLRRRFASSQDGVCTVDGAAFNYFYSAAGSLLYPAAPRPASLPAVNDHPLFILFNNDAASWQLLPTLPSSYDVALAPAGPRPPSVRRILNRRSD